MTLGRPEQSPSQLLDQLVETVELLAATAEEQRVWSVDHKVPIDELMQGFTDIVPMWINRLREGHAINDEGELALLRLRVQFDAYMTHRPDLFQNWQVVADSSEWGRVRDLAQQALRALEEPHDDNT